MPKLIEVDAMRWDETVRATISDLPLHNINENLLPVECVCGSLRKDPSHECPEEQCSSRRVRAFRGKNFAQQFSLDPKGLTRSASWFHATIDPCWEEQLNKLKLPVHVGEEDAARTLGREYLDVAGGYFLYETNILLDATVADYLCPDLHLQWSSSLGEFKSHVGSDFVGYVNLYEGAGSVSLVGDPAKLKVRGRTWVPLLTPDESIESLRAFLSRGARPSYMDKQAERLLDFLNSQI